MLRLRSILALVMAVCLSGLGSAAVPRNVSVAAAADLQFALADIKTAFAKVRPDIHVTVTYGSSGNFYAQIVNGAPFDLYLSADENYPTKLVEAGLADRSTAFRYSRGRLVLWVLKGSPIALEKLGLKALLDPAARRVAIANPRHAPYGRAAEAALTRLGLLDAVQPRLVYGENIAQTAQFVQAGAADIGILALSLAKAPAMAATGRSFELPLDAYPALEQGGVVLARTRDLPSAQALCAFLQGSEGRIILQRYGFLVDGQ